MAYRVLIVANEHPQLSPGGAGQVAYLLFNGLQQVAGVEAFFLARTEEPARRRDSTPFSSHRGRAEEILFFTDTVDDFLFSQRSLEVIEHFTALIDRIDPDVIHFHHYLGIGLELIAAARRKRPKVRIFVTLHEYLAICANFGQMVKTNGMALCQAASPHDCASCFKDIAPAEFLLRETFIKSHFEKVDMFIAPSEFLRQRYIAWGIPVWQITVVENGIAPLRPPPPRSLGEGERRSSFGFFGQIIPYKGVVELLTAFEYLGQFPAPITEGIRLVINGAIPEQNPRAFVERVRELLGRTRHRVHFAGAYRNEDLHRLMAAVDWVVVPSLWWENSPMVIEEALAHRRPVISSNIGGMVEKIRWGKDGLHFAVGNPFELASLVVQLAAENSVWDGLQQTMRQPTTIGESVSRHLQYYRDQSFAVAG
ncbi:MAG TPA: glycosyltransferase family 4 protein [Stellaceae bacterium]|nr:glycosyltransferase family 4 protein [Stellaceae bacterium]